MAVQPAGSYVTHLLSYAIASADMYYTEMERCDVFLSCNERENLHIWGQTAYGEPPITKDLFEMFLEYALYCGSLPDREEMRSAMQNFGERLGRSLANHLQNDVLLSRSCTSICQILKYILETVDSHPYVDSDDTEMCVTVADYPLEKVAKRSGLWNIELAHYGINSMCQCLIHCINPHLSVNASADIHSEFIFTILMPSYA
jgi:hypothetical protein